MVPAFSFPRSLRIIPQPIHQLLTAFRIRTIHPAFPFRNRTKVPSNNLPKFPKRHLHPNPPSPNRLNKRLRRAFRVNRRHRVVISRQNPLLQRNTPRNGPCTNSQRSPGLLHCRAFGPHLDHALSTPRAKTHTVLSSTEQKRPALVGIRRTKNQYAHSKCQQQPPSLRERRMIGVARALR